MMTRKHYKAIAAAIREARSAPFVRAYSGDAVMHHIADVCAADNPRFNRARFIAACVPPQQNAV